MGRSIPSLNGVQMGHRLVGSFMSFISLNQLWGTRVTPALQVNGLNSAINIVSQNPNVC